MNHEDRMEEGPVPAPTTRTSIIRRRRDRPRRRTAWALALALVTALLCMGPPAAAHDDLVASDPPEQGVVETLPSRAVLTMSGEIKEVREITVTGPDGSVTNGEPTFAGIEIRQNLWAGPDGPYVLGYSIVSADGHEMTGEVHFQVGPVVGPKDRAAPGKAATADSATKPWDRFGTAALTILAILVVAGGLVIWRRRRLGGESA